MRFFKMDNSTKRLFEVVIDDLDEVLSQAVDKHEREEAFSNDGLDEILSQSLDMFEKVKNSVEDASLEGLVWLWLGDLQLKKVRKYTFLTIFVLFTETLIQR